MHRLITIRFSHYNERARWALDRFRVPYRELPYMPMLHIGGVLWATRGRTPGQADRVSSPLSTPVLITDRDECLRDSGEIVRYVSERYGTRSSTLYPDPEVAELERHFHDQLGPHTRAVIYHYGLPHRSLAFTMADRNVGKGQAATFKLFHPLLSRMVVRALKITPERVARSLQRIPEVLDEVAARLGTKRYLVGDSFTAADLTFACMAAPVMMIGASEGYGAHLPSFDEAPPELSQLARRLRRGPTGEYVLRLFREERGERQIPCDPP